MIKSLSSSSVVEKNQTNYLEDFKGGDILIPQILSTNVVVDPTTTESLLDQYTQIAAQMNTNPYFKYCNIDPVISGTGESITGGAIALISNDAWMTAKLKYFFNKLNVQVIDFKSKEELDEEVKSDNYGKSYLPNGRPRTICFGISFDQTNGNNWVYNLHFNTTGNPETKDLPDPAEPQEELFKEEGDTLKYYKMYFQSGFMAMQSLIDNLILRKSLDSDNVVASQKANIQTRYIKMPVKKYSDKGLYSNTNDGSIELYIIFPLLVIYLGFIFHMLKEKEKKITENMRNMGMSLLAHYLAWYSFYALVLFGCSVIWTVIVKLTFFTSSNVILVWSLFFLTGLVLLSVSFVVCSFFIASKPGVLLGIVVFFLFYGVSIIVGSVESPTEGIYNMFALSPFTSMSFAAKNAVLLESYNSYGIGFEHIGLVINYFKFRTFIIICILESIILLLIGIYLDLVFPTEIGIKKHPLFFCGMKYKNDVADRQESMLDDGSYAQEYYEELTQDLIVKKRDPRSSLQIHNLRKVYSNGKIAVHNLSLDMFDNQIFALLGHNGAGKTTTISMISGLLTQSSGSINICGFDTKTQYDEIKKLMGVCPQLNPIYDNLTCYEHLKLYGRLKRDGQSPISEDEIIQILKDIDLLGKKDFPASKLSGGQKRKLCIGIAFIGGSKVILLDEPTSGMDTYARRFLWEMIKRYKKDRIIILCTHYMDEADFLGDRFGIMGEGRLVTSGTSLFLKKKFGVGYDLTVVKESSQSSSQVIEDLVRKIVPSSVKSGDISMEVKFRLPTEESSRFEGLFKELEDNKKQYGIQSFGISLTTLEEVFLRVAVGGHDKNDLDAKENELLENASDYDFELENVRIKGKMEIFRMHFGALCKKRFIYFKRDLKGVFCEVILPILIITAGLCITLIRFVRDPTPQEIQPSQFFSKDVKTWMNIPSGVSNPSDFQALITNIPVVKGFSIAKTTNNNSLADHQMTLLDQYVAERYWSYYLESVNPTDKIFKYTVFFNTTTAPSSPISTNIMNQAILRYTTGDPKASIKIGSSSLKLTKQIASFNNTAVGFIAVFLFSLAYAFIPAGIILFIVKEREHNSKHQQIVSGVSIYAYWFSNLLIDYMKYLIPGIYTGLSILIFGVDAFTERDNYSMVWALIISYGPAMLGFTYLTSFFFTNPESAQIFTFIFNFLAGLIFMIISFALRVIKSTRDIAPYFPELLLRLIPTFDFSWGLFQITNSHIWQIGYKLEEKPGAWSRWGGLIDFIYLCILGIVYMIIVFYIELRDTSSDSPALHEQQLIDFKDVDPDVEKERLDVLKYPDFAIRVVDLVKQFVMLSKKGGFCSTKLIEKKTAVKGVSFGVRKGDCFGLLGTNGAGKTTTFKALSGEILPTLGNVQIAGYDLKKDMGKVRYLIGYCPQFETLLDNLTSREHLELYSAIKGIPENMREKLINDKLKQLNLKKFEHVQAGTYSGGNKRKLSVAIALLGNPPIILLDEPSSGMDPEARRFMWSVVGKISSEMKHSSVVLTTHSMEEAEALSTKLAIMVEGKFACIGPVQSLKNKYGKGFEIELKIAQPTKEEIRDIKRSLNINNNNGFSNSEIAPLFDRFNIGDMKSEIREDGKLSVLYQQVYLL